jgi:osmoprotectant transport system substrate-binding protein
VGVVGLEDVYGVEFKEFKSLDSSGPLVLIADRKADSTVRKALARLGNVLTTAQLTELNRQADRDKKDPEDVANAYAKQHGPA